MSPPVRVSSLQVSGRPRPIGPGWRGLGGCRTGSRTRRPSYPPDMPAHTPPCTQVSTRTHPPTAALHPSRLAARPHEYPPRPNSRKVLQPSPRQPCPAAPHSRAAPATCAHGAAAPARRVATIPLLRYPMALHHVPPYGCGTRGYRLQPGAGLARPGSEARVPTSLHHAQERLLERCETGSWALKKDTP